MCCVVLEISVKKGRNSLFITQTEENLQLLQRIAVAAWYTHSSLARARTNNGTALNRLLNKPQPT